jgi:hypothetical protein
VYSNADAKPGTQPGTRQASQPNASRAFLWRLAWTGRNLLGCLTWRLGEGGLPQPCPTRPQQAGTGSLVSFASYREDCLPPLPASLTHRPRHHERLIFSRRANHEQPQMGCLRYTTYKATNTTAPRKTRHASPPSPGRPTAEPPCKAVREVGNNIHPPPFTLSRLAAATVARGMSGVICGRTHQLPKL